MRWLRNKFQVAQNRLKAYTNNFLRELEFKVGDHVFGIKEKLISRHVDPFEILNKVGEVVYRLALPQDLAGVHNVFHILTLRKYVYDNSHMIEYTWLQLRKDLTYEGIQ